MPTEKKRIQKDIVIIGAGMAGLTAALYAGRMNLSVLVLENALVGGQIACQSQSGQGTEMIVALPLDSGKSCLLPILAK